MDNTAIMKESTVTGTNLRQASGPSSIVEPSTGAVAVPAVISASNTHAIEAKKY